MSKKVRKPAFAELYVICANCGSPILKELAVQRDGKFYCKGE